MSVTKLHDTNFPLYTVNVLDKDLFLVAGGGGAAKTGVPNSMFIFRVQQNKKEIKAVKVHEFDAERKAIMNCSVHPKEKSIAIGKDNECHLLTLEIKSKPIKDTSKKQGTEFSLVYKVSKLCSEVTVTNTSNGGDENQGESDYQKVVKFTPDGGYLVTGASNGYVCILKYPAMKCLHNFKAHETDVDDLDIHPSGKRFVTVSRDTKAFVWKLEEGKKEFELFYTGPNGEENPDHFRIRACRFGVSERGDINLFTIQVPSKFDRQKPLESLLVKWDCSKWIPMLSRPIGLEPPTQMTISNDSRYIGVGTSAGSVSVYIAWNLMPLVRVENVHNIFVTGLAFLPPSPVLEKTNKELALLTISADNTCKLLTITNRTEFSIWWLLVGAVILLYFTFVGLSYLGIDL